MVRCMHNSVHGFPRPLRERSPQALTRPPPPLRTPPTAGGAAVKCPAVDGYLFYRLQNAVGALMTRRGVPAPTSTSASAALARMRAVQALAAACDAAPVCNAFSTWGDLKVVPPSPVFEVLDSSSGSAFGACDGMYMRRQGSLLGLEYAAGQGGVSPAANQQQAAGAARNMLATIEAARKVSRAWLG